MAEKRDAFTIACAREKAARDATSAADAKRRPQSKLDPKEAAIVAAARTQPNARTTNGQVIDGWKPGALNAINTLSGVAPDGTSRASRILAALGMGNGQADPVKIERVDGAQRITSKNPNNPWHAFVGPDSAGRVAILVLHYGTQP